MIPCAPGHIQKEDTPSLLVDTYPVRRKMNKWLVLRNLIPMTSQMFQRSFITLLYLIQQIVSDIK